MVETKALERSKALDLHLLARYISIITTPAIVGSLMLFDTLHRFSPSTEIFLETLAIVFFFSIFLPVFFTLYLLKKERIGNFHIQERRERTVPFSFALVSSTGSLLAIKYLGASPEMTKMLLIFYLMSLGFVAITSWRYKISGHMFIFCSSIFLLISFVDMRYVYLLPLAVPIAWSRVYLREHTRGEILGAIGYSIISFFTFMLLINN